MCRIEGVNVTSLIGASCDFDAQAIFRTSVLITDTVPISTSNDRKPCICGHVDCDDIERCFNVLYTH